VKLRATNLSAGPLPVLDVDAMLQRLPAEARASVVWARKPIADALLSLRREPLTDDLVASVAEGFFAPLQAVAAKVWEVLAENPEQLRAAIMSDFAREEAALGQFLNDANCMDTLAWITGFLRSFYGTVFTVVPSHQWAALAAQQAWQDAVREPQAARFVRGVVTLMAASDEARSGADVVRARDLIDVSFLRFRESRDALRASGWYVSAYPFETSEQRRDALRASAIRIRESFSDGDWETISAARMGSLR
jgi:hypothetical protein